MFERSKLNPILKPDKSHSWEDFKTYNPAMIYENGIFHLFYRARGKKWISTIGYASSIDGENFERFSEPILKPEEFYENNGLEDPRVVKIEEKYFMTYTAFDGITARLSIATSNDLKNWKKHGKVFENWNWTKSLGLIKYLFELTKKVLKLQVFKKDWCKAGGIIPQKINGQYYMLFGDKNIWLATSKNGINWQPIQKPFISARGKEFFDNNFVEMGPTPIKTEKGWLVLYHGIDKKHTYRLGFVILDINDPSKIIFRSEKPIFEPEEPYELRGAVDILPGGWETMEKMSEQELQQFTEEYEKKGKMPKVTFVCGAVVVGEKIKIYYGASDMVTCTATANLNDILNTTNSNQK